VKGQASREVWGHAPPENFVTGSEIHSLGDISLKKKIDFGQGQNAMNQK